MEISRQWIQLHIKKSVESICKKKKKKKDTRDTAELLDTNLEKPIILERNIIGLGILLTMNPKNQKK